ncbi:unnamed protein product [Aureobasidium mustum]|uniref:Apple domain-containing protein n=1 Tax=Aureobasidium mustum TaxID=2773714 RepID=A0A9N8PIZ9_9PEZI|nr:unnamed protein product [Aureobasidium mustum]
MQLIFGLAVASLLKATTALVSNGTTETVFITQTAWSTVFSCPAPQTVTVCNAQCTSPPPMPVNNANIIYQTVSDCQAGQVLTIDGTQTTLAQATILTLENTIADLVLNPASVTINDYTASATLTEVVYPLYTGNSGEIVTCQTGVTTISGDNVVLSNCPCTVQSTVLEITATATGAVPSAVVSSSYIVKIIYIYEVEVIVEQVPTTITTTATEVLTTVQTTTQTGTVTTTASSRPTIVTVDRVTFLLRYDTTFDGVAVGGLRKRQTIGSPLISTALNACLAQCAEPKRLCWRDIRHCYPQTLYINKLGIVDKLCSAIELGLINENGIKHNVQKFDAECDFDLKRDLIINIIIDTHRLELKSKH